MCPPRRQRYNESLRDLLEALTAAFASIHPRLRFAFTNGAGPDVEVVVTELDDAGAIVSLVQQTLDLTTLSTDPRAHAFVAGAALRARARAERHASSPRFLDWFTPRSVLPIVLLDASELTTAEAFAAAGGDGFSRLARLETLALCDALQPRLPAAIAAVRRHDDDDLALVDAMFAIFSDRFDAGHTLALIRRVGADDRRHLAPLLVAYLHETARDEDLRTNAYRRRGEPITRPIAQDAALHLLVGWGVNVRGEIDGWLGARAISADAAAKAREPG